jgi:hypothetical protein
MYPPAITGGNWKSHVAHVYEIFNGTIIYKCWIFHCHVWLPEGKYHISPQNPLNPIN